LRRHIHPDPKIPSGNPVVEGSWWISCSWLGEDPIQQLTVGFQADHHEMVHVRDILFYSTCEHHLPDDRQSPRRVRTGRQGGRARSWPGSWKVTRVVPSFRSASPPRWPTPSTEASGPRGPSSWWRRITSLHDGRGVQKPGSMTVTSAVCGIYAKDQRTRQEAMSLITGQR
jgi:GTP cyclohydrolase IA